MDPSAQLPLAFRLEKKPHVIMGLTWVECCYAALFSALGAVALGLTIGAWIDNPMFALPAFLVICVVLFVLVGKFMERYKHNRPDGYYQQKLYGLLQVLRFGSYYITRSGYRDPRREGGSNG